MGWGVGGGVVVGGERKSVEGDRELLTCLRTVSHCCHYRRNVAPGGRREEKEC